MRTETIKEEKIAEVKALTEGKFSRAESTDETVILRADVDKETYCKIADIDLKTVSLLGNIYGILEYFENGGLFTLKCETYLNTEEEDYMEEKLSIEYTAWYDFLELFTEKKKEEEKDTSLEDFFNDNIGNVVRKLKEMYPDVVSDIENEVINHLSDYDLTDEEVANIGETWAEDNPDEAFNIGIRNLSGYDLKDKIKDAIDEL